MEKLSLISLLLLSLLKATAQNLVPNPSFESYTTCPTNFSSTSDDQITRAIGWSSFKDTPDYFNSCTSFSGIKVPANGFGFQYARTGNGYCGGQTYNKYASSYREIIGAKLLSPLIVGQKYFVTFYINLAGKYGAGVYATNRFGAKFTSSVHSYTYLPIPITNFSHISDTAFVKDTLLWKRISGSFIADSAYKYVAFGNFFDDLNTDTFCIDNSNAFKTGGYYYIDDVCVSTDSLYSLNWTRITEFSNSNSIKVFPNPFSKKAFVEFTDPPQKDYSFLLYNLEGKLVFEKTEIVTERFEIERDDLPDGLYFFHIMTNNAILCKGKIVIE